MHEVSFKRSQLDQLRAPIAVFIVAVVQCIQSFLLKIICLNYFHSIRPSCAKVGINIIRHNYKTLRAPTLPSNQFTNVASLFSMKLLFFKLLLQFQSQHNQIWHKHRLAQYEYITDVPASQEPRYQCCQLMSKCIS